MKRISPATVTFGVMAIVLGLVAAYVVRQALTKPAVVQQPAPPAPQPEMVQVVFAKNVVAKHSRLTPADVFLGAIPKGSKLPAGAFRGINLIEGRITKDAIGAGKVIREEHLLGLDETLPDLSERLPPGHRAVTILVQGADTGGKRLAEGDHIDIALTVEGTHPDLGEVMTRTLMQNVLVVDAAESRPLVRGNRKSNEPTDSSITVAVLPPDANKLIVAQKTGVLQATLVSAQEPAAFTPTDDAVNRRQLLGLKEVAPPKKFTVEKWTGSSVQFLEMSNDRIQESRNVSPSRETPVTKQANPADNVSRSIPSGVTRPDAAFAGEELVSTTKQTVTTEGK